MSTDKFQRISNYCIGADVLDLGCIGDNVSEGGPLGLFNSIRSVANSVVGIDNNTERLKLIAKINADNPTDQVLVLHGDAEQLKQMQFKKKFDVIVASELIEHLSNPGLFLDGIYDHLAPGGKAIITTPNAFFSLDFIRLMLRGKPQIWYEHTCMFDEITATEIFRQHGFEVERCDYITDIQNKSGLIRRIMAFWNRRFGHTMFFVLKKSR